MSRWLPTGALTWVTWAALIVAVPVGAAPFVAGFERFHAARPDSDGGRLLYNELGCAQCHGGDTGLPPRRGPDLATVTRRAQPDWLMSFIAAPGVGSGMPHLFAGRDRGDAEAVVHFLATLAPKRNDRPRLIRHVNAARGRELYHLKGCVACHAPREDFLPPDGPVAAGQLRAASVPLPDLKAKYVLAALSEFIRDPLKARSDGRMPRIEMDEQDATDIAGYLLDIGGSDGQELPGIELLAIDAEKADRGRNVVTALRCASCHPLAGLEPPPRVEIRNGDAGCMVATPAPGRPHYALSPAQRAAIQAYLSRPEAPLPASRQAALALEALNCVACHERDRRGGPEPERKAYFTGDHNLGDTGRFPPPLTGVGRKLQPSWLGQVFEGQARVRPYLQTQMPVYGAATATLPALFARADGAAVGTLPPGDREAGRKLLGTQGGVNCITCHRWSGRASLGIQALDISNLAARLQPGWLREYLVDPAVHRPGTLMPSFWPGGKAANQDILGGDTDRQIASILAFAREGKDVPDGFPSTAAGEFELIPKDRPIVLRTFLQDVGTHAILVGFPAGIHLAYDGKAGRPALLWRGRFFDAYGTWFSRFAPFEKPLGAAHAWPAPGIEAPRRCDGYRLDAAGVPTFLLSVGGVKLEERFEVTPTSLRRTLLWNAEELRDLSVAHPEGVSVTEEAGSAAGRRVYLYTW